MRELTGAGRLVGILLSISTVLAGTAAHARPKGADGLPCNDLCRAWMGYDKPEGATESPVEDARPAATARPASPAAPEKLPRPAPDAAMAAHPLPAAVPLPPEPPGAAAKRRRPKTRLARGAVPLPVPRPALPGVAPAVAALPAAEAPSADVGRREPSPDATVRPAGPSGPDVARAPAPSDAPPAIAPTDRAGAAPPAPPIPAAPDGNPARPDAAGSGPRTDEPASADAAEIELRPIPTPSGSPLSVQIGQISAEPRGTDVHVVVVNVLREEIRDAGVRCEARDAGGLKVAAAFARVGRVIPADVAFVPVLFPAEITVRDNRFACEIGTIASAVE